MKTTNILWIFLFCTQVVGLARGEQPKAPDSQNRGWRFWPPAWTSKKPDPSEKAQTASSVPLFEVQTLVQGLGMVWGMVFINPNEILLTEKQGHFKKLNIKTGKLQKVRAAVSVYSGGQGGLMDVRLHPRFSTNRRVYFAYSKKIGPRRQSTAIAYGILIGHQLAEIKDIFMARPEFSSRIHFGCRMAFDKKGFLFVSIGDRGRRQEAQKKDSHLGKILRLNDEGKPAKGNPFENHPRAFKEIWSLGHRNPQGLYFHPRTQKLWIHEHGPRGGDELNRIQKGGNYGWPVVTYGKEYWGPSIGEGYKKQGIIPPVKYYTPSIAPSGLLVYSGKKIKQWEGDFFSGSLAFRHLNRLKIKNGKVIKEERLLKDQGFRVRHIIEGPEGFIYLSTDEGHILRLRPPGS